MTAIELLIEQYRTVRQESLDALNQMQTINQWGLGSIGVSVGLGLVASERSVVAAAVVLMGLVPGFIAFGIVTMSVITQRIIHTRLYLRLLEKELGVHFDGFVGWERTRARNFRIGTSGYPFALLTNLGIAIGIGPGLGAALLASHGEWMAFIVGEVIDVIALASFSWWIIKVFKDMGVRNASELADKS
jgi:hypothetical protein